MKYSEEVFALALSELDSRRNAAIAEKKRREKEISEKFPEIANMDAELAKSVELLYRFDKSFTTIRRIADMNIAVQEKKLRFLSAVGYPEGYLDYHYTCTECEDTGYVDGIRCRCFDELLEKYAVIELSRGCSIELHDLEEFDLKYYDGNDREFMSSVLDMCIRYADNFSTDSDSMFFLGGTGLGKTFLSSAIVKKVIGRGFTVVYDSILNLLRKIENEHFGREAGNTMELLLSAELVVLDDLGSEFRSSFSDTAVYNIINSRINAHLPTIISSNLSFKELNSSYNERIVSRLKGDFIPVQFRGKDIREQKRINKQ